MRQLFKLITVFFCLSQVLYAAEGDKRDQDLAKFTIKQAHTSDWGDYLTNWGGYFSKPTENPTVKSTQSKFQVFSRLGDCWGDHFSDWGEYLSMSTKNPTVNLAGVKLKQVYSRLGDSWRYLSMSTKNPTVKDVIIKASIGLGAAFTMTLIEEHSPIYIDPITRTASYYPSLYYGSFPIYLMGNHLLFNAAYDIISMIYNHIESRAISKIKIKDKKSNNNLQPEDIKRIVHEKNRLKLSYVERIASYGFSSIILAKELWRFIPLLYSFYEYGASPFAFSFPEGYTMGCTPGRTRSFLDLDYCRPITIPILTMLYTITLFHDLRELSFCTDPESFIKRGYVPFYSMVNTFSQANSLKFLDEKYSDIESYSRRKKYYEKLMHRQFKVDIPEVGKYVKKFNDAHVNNRYDGILNDHFISQAVSMLANDYPEIITHRMEQGYSRDVIDYIIARETAELYYNYHKTVDSYKDFISQNQHHISGLNWVSYFFLKNYFNYQAYKNFVLVFKNLFSYFNAIPSIEVINDEPKIDQEQPTKQPRKKKGSWRSGGEKPIAPAAPSKQATPEETRGKDFQESDSYDPSSRSPKKKKKKTKTQDAHSAPKFKKDQKHIADKGKKELGQKHITDKGKKGLEMPVDLRREAGLKSVQNLRNKYPINVNVLKKALEDLAGFLSGEIEGITGSEFRLVWVVNGTRYAMKYELPHGKDAGNFVGKKRLRILNILELGYLKGLSETQIKTYIEQNERYNILRFPKFLRFLLMNANR